MLANLVLTPVPGGARDNVDDDFTLSVTVTTIETNLDGGQIETERNSQTYTIPVTVDPVADAVSITGSSTVIEDQTVTFGADITLTKADQNSTLATGPSSETITKIVVSGIPVGATLDTGSATSHVLVDTSVAGQVTLTLQSGGTETDIQAALDKLKLTPPTDSDLDITLSLAVTTVDRWDTAEASAGNTTSGLTHTIAVRAEADSAGLTVPSPNSGLEDQPIAIAFSVARNDTDPSQATASEAIETVVIRNIPAGFTLSSTSAAATLTLNPDGSYTVTGPNLADPVANDAAINAVLANLVLTPVPGGARDNVDDDFTLSVTVTTIETNLDGGQIETERNSQTYTIPVTVDPVADAVSITGSSTVIEDQTVTFGADITLTKADQNSTLATGPSSETITKIVVSGIPVGATLDTGSATSHVLVDTSVAGQVTLTLQSGGTEADIQAALDKLKLTPLTDSDLDITLSLAVTTVDRWDTAEASAGNTTSGLTHTIAVTADAAGDEPTISGAATGVEDTTFGLPITIGLGDTDGSEILDKVTITGLPTGAVISWLPADLPAGVTATAIMTGPQITGWTFDQTSASYATTLAFQTFLSTKLSVTPPSESAADFTLSVQAFNYEQNLSGAGGRTAALPSTTASVVVTVTPALDPVSLGASATLVNEDEHRAPASSDGSAPFVTIIPGSVVFGDDIEAVLTRSDDVGEFNAADRSEGVSQIVLSGFPAASSVTWTDQTGVIVTAGPAGTYTIAVDGTNPPASPAQLEQAIRNVLKTFTFGAPDHDASNVTVAISVTRQDVDPDTGAVLSSVAATGTHQITVNAVADAPIVTGDSETTREDIAVHLDSLTAVLRDTDGSETLTVQVTGVDSAARLTNALGTEYAYVLAAGTKTYSIPTASLGNVYFNPPAQAHGTYNMKIIATATEATVAGEATADDVAKVEAPITVVVTPVVDAVAANNSGSIVDENGTFNLGANILESPVDADVIADVSLADLDGSQNLIIVITGFPAGVTGFVNPAYTLPSGITANFNAGTGTFTLSGTNAATVLTALAQVRATVTEDGDANFNLTVSLTTDENSPVSEVGDYQSLTTVVTHAVQVKAVADAPTVDAGAATKTAVTEDSGFVTYPVTTHLNDTDGSETYKSIVVAYSVPGSGSAPAVQFGTTTGVTFDTSVAGQIKLTGAAADIDAAMATLQVRPGAQNDADITVTITAIAVESNPTEANDNGPGVAGNEITTPTAQTIASFVIPVAAIADTPTLTGSAVGLEDQNIALSMVAGHADAADGSERIKDVVIANVPSGFTLSESSLGAGTLTLNPNGTYTVTGPTDAAINDVLDKLTLVFVPNGGRQHLDTEFNLSVTVTTREFTPSETGTGQIGQLEASQTFTVPVTVTAVVDGVTFRNDSTIVEDVKSTIGGDIAYDHIDADGSEKVTTITVTGFPVGTSVEYTDVGGTAQAFVATGSETITLTGGTEAQIRAALDTLSVKAPPHSDVNFNLTVKVTTEDNDSSVITDTRVHAVTVQAVADAPSVTAGNISLGEDSTTTLVINPNRSLDDDNSETLSVRITIPSDGLGVLGTLSGATPANVTLTAQGGGVYLVQATGATPADRETALDGYLNGGITFTPRAQWSGVLTGTGGIKVEAISTEAATGGELAPAGFGGADGTSKTETTTTYIDVTVLPVNDLPVAANASTTVIENNNSTSPTDPDLTVSIGSRLGLTIADTDGSQGLFLTLTGFPTNAQALTFATTRAGVTTSTNLATGTVTVDGANANDVLVVLNSLSVRLADDDDRNFTVTINGTSRDTNGSTTIDDPFTLTHAVIVKAAADQPVVGVGAATKSAVDEDSGYITYPVTVGLNDTDGSETMQSVLVTFSTPGTGARPEVNFTTTGGIIFDTSTPGQVRLTGATADIIAAMATLQVRPGAANGEDITVTVTATSVESNPSEPDVAGSEIATATAQTVATFVIPVNPVPEVPGLTLPANPTGSEDVAFALGSFGVSATTTDPDGSETRYIEISTSSYPSGTVFSSGGVGVGSIVTAGWLRIPSSALSSLSIQGPANFSGTINLSIRGVVVDASTSGNVTDVTAPQTLVVTVTPDADAVTAPTVSLGVEDLGAVAFGAALANTTTGIRVVDNGTGTGNNAATETLSEVSLDFPADTATQTYSITAGAASGSASATFDPFTRTYTITSTIITGAADIGALSLASRQQAETDIRAVLAGFSVTMGPTHTDLDGIVAVTAKTLDVNGGVYNIQPNTFNHTIQIQAVADTPSVSVTDPVGSSAEDVASIPLTINAGNSADADGSETLSVRITVPSDSLGAVGSITGTPPANVTLTDLGGGVFRVTASGPDSATREARLDSFLQGGGIAFTPRTNWSGTLLGTAGLKVEVISTEAATGTQLAPDSNGGPDGVSATETVTDYIDIRVAPIADTPSVKGNGVGLEDSIISVPMSVTLADKDGSETYGVELTAVVPVGTRIFGAGGVELLPNGFGVYTLTPADVAALAVQPPLHYSTALSGDIVLSTRTTVTDTSSGGSSQTTFDQDIHVNVTGVADPPQTRMVVVTADEDETIDLGAAILASASGNLNNLLVDTDGSESLSFVLGGLPSGVIPGTSNPSGGVTYLGSGTWSITAAAMATLTLPPVPNFSGENPYAGVTIRAVTQEIDGDQATSSQWPVTIKVYPVIDAGTADGFDTWSMGVTQSEAASEAGTGISLASATNHTFKDADGSESVVSYTFNLSGLIADAGIATRLASLPGTGTGLDKLVASYLSGTFTYNSGAGTITVLASNIGGVTLNSQLFADSNEDFSIPVTAIVRDTAIIDGLPVSVDKVESGTFNVDLVGTADVPTVFASSASGGSGTLLPLNLGGVSTDTDASLGRTPSEGIYYIVAILNPGTAPALGFTNAAGDIVGLDNGDGTWVLTPADLVGLHVTTPGGTAGTANLRLTTIATENDGDVASNSTTFNVVVTSQPGGGGTPPLPPSVTIGTNAGNEDGSITLSVTATPAPGDTSNPSVAVMISNLPAGTQIIGATFNSDTGRWVASAAAVNAGLVKIIPPADFSGTMPITIEAVATNAALLKATTGTQTVGVTVDPVADGVAISTATVAGSEDTAIALNVSLAERDTDGNEVIGDFCYVKLTNGATLVGGYPTVVAGDADASIDGTSLLGYIRVPTAAMATLQMLPANDWHGSIDVTVAAYSVEPADNNDGDNIQLDVASFTVKVAAVADAPLLTVPVGAAGDEDTAIALIGLTAALDDLITTNGAEVLSAKISGIPAGSVLSAGSNNGDGSWTIPLSSLGALSITPPHDYSGTMTLTLTAIALELSNGSEAQTSVAFAVAVAPKADTVEIVADNIAVDATATAALDLNIRMSDNRGTEPGENPAELIHLTFTSVPTGITFSSTLGGTLTNPAAGTYEFVGTESQANALTAVAGSTATGGLYTISVSAVTHDGASTLAVPVTDSFQLSIPTVMTGGIGADTLTGTAGTQLLFGLGGADTLSGGDGADRLDGGPGADILIGGKGADVLTGGTGSDTYVWQAGDNDGSIDRIVGGFDGVTTPASGGDVIDLSQLLPGYVEGTSNIANFVQFNVSGSNTTVRIDTTGTGNFAAGTDIVTIEGVTGLDLNQMKAHANLVA
ncbi:MAG: type I secretion C-terminal target domain-containing protein [Hyphomicrobiaceae bacterium]